MFNAKANFKSMYPNNLQCNYCLNTDLQTQRHLLEDCDAIISNSQKISENIHIDHDFIYGSSDQQLEVAKLYIEIQKVRENLDSI